MLMMLWNGYVVLLHATAYLAGTWFVLAAVHRQGPAARAFVHAAGLIGMLAVAALCWLPIGWWAWIMPAAVTEPLVRIGAASVVTSTGTPSVLAWALVVTWIIYVAGAALSLFRIVTGCWLIHRASRDATAVPQGEWQALLRDACAQMSTPQNVELRQSAAVSTAMTCGVLDPVILIPPDAERWPTEHRRLVLLHELAHIRRFDWAVRLAAQCALALYWFHPGARAAMRALITAQEEACDALVLRSGIRRSTYAECLLQSMHWARGAGMPRMPGGALALGMASTPHLHRRIRRILSAPVRASSSPSLQRCAAVLLAAWLMLAGSIRLAPQRHVMWRVLESRDWSRRAYAAAFLSHTRNPAVHARLRAATAAEPSAIVRSLAQGTY
jgi:beta-lactamase regulating signal transducer with metallopeptidase domain